MHRPCSWWPGHTQRVPASTRTIRLQRSGTARQQKRAISKHRLGSRNVFATAKAWRATWLKPLSGTARRPSKGILLHRAPWDCSTQSGKGWHATMSKPISGLTSPPPQQAPTRSAMWPIAKTLAHGSPQTSSRLSANAKPNGRPPTPIALPASDPALLYGRVIGTSATASTRPPWSSVRKATRRNACPVRPLPLPSCKASGFSSVLFRPIVFISRTTATW
jgi:hypothetical protein